MFQSLSKASISRLNRRWKFSKTEALCFRLSQFHGFFYSGFQLTLFLLVQISQIFFHYLDSSYWILTTYGYSIENDIRQANQEAELIQINLANEDDKAQHCHLGHYPELRTAHASGGFVDDQLLVCGGSRSDMDPMKSSHPLCFVLGNSRVMAYSEFPRGMAASLPISDYLWITGGWNSLTQEITKSTERIILGAKSESGPDLPFPLAGHCLFQLNKTMALLTGGRTHAVNDFNIHWIQLNQFI